MAPRTLEKSNGDYVAFINAHVMVRHSIQRSVAMAANSSTGCIVPVNRATH
jgi:hypothetical protein